MAATKDSDQPVMVTAMPRRARFAHGDAEAEEADKPRRPTPVPIRRDWRPSTVDRDE